MGDQVVMSSFYQCDKHLLMVPRIAQGREWDKTTCFYTLPFHNRWAHIQVLCKTTGPCIHPCYRHPSFLYMISNRYCFVELIERNPFFFLIICEINIYIPNSPHKKKKSMPTILQCSAKSLQSEKLPKHLWMFINSFVPPLERCTDCMFTNWLRTWACNGCKSRLCENHFARALYWGQYYRKCSSVALCDNCCWDEI